MPSLAALARAVVDRWVAIQGSLRWHLQNRSNPGIRSCC